MFRSDDLEVWNLTPEGDARREAQEVFNVVGRVRDPESVESFSYSLNGDPGTPIVLRQSEAYEGGRLWFQGDFSIDTIPSSRLSADNVLTLRLLRRDGNEAVHRVPFRCTPPASPEPRFRLDLDGVNAAEEVGQVVDGNWRVARDERGEPCLEIAKEDAGYDRIILFGRSDWSTGYEVTARLAPTAWTSPHHNMGLVFKWNPHLVGDGTSLPTQWSTGLGYYCSYTPGLRLRFGTNVHLDESGRKIGDHVLEEKPFSPVRRLAYRLLNDIGKRRLALSQMPVGRHYRFRLRVDPERYALTAWPAGRAEPDPQVVVPDPVEHLAHGSVGVIALCCALRVYELEVTPL